MIEIIVFMAPAVCMCIILAGICGYVGIHVIMREVIFIDIALAQVAALGVSMGMFLHLEPDSPWAYAFALAGTLAAAALLSGTRRLASRAPQEAFIGIMYATAAAAVVLAGDRLPHGSEHVQELMMGHLLWVSWKEVGLYAVIYAALGGVYALFHHRLIAVSAKCGEKAETSGHAVFWDFVFYALLGVLVTFAVKVAGVLLVFGFLIVPAVIGFLLGNSFMVRLAIAWSAGVLISLAGCLISYVGDFPTGGTVVVTLGVCLLLVAAPTALVLRKREQTPQE